MLVNKRGFSVALCAKIFYGVKFLMRVDIAEPFGHVHYIKILKIWEAIMLTLVKMDQLYQEDKRHEFV